MLKTLHWSKMYIVSESALPCTVIEWENLALLWLTLPAKLYLCAALPVGLAFALFQSAFEPPQKAFIAGCHRASTLLHWQAKDILGIGCR